VNLKNRLIRWHNGTEVIHEHENDPGSMFVFLPSTKTEYHWSAKVVRAVVNFLREEWKWVIGIALAIAGLLLKFL
jgi:hypothetical protein